MFWEEFRQWILPGLGLVSLVWQILAALRKNSVRREDLSAYAKTEDLLAVNKVLQDQIDESDKRITEAHHKTQLLDQKVATGPTYSDINRLREAISKLEGAVGKLSADVEGLDKTVDKTGSSVERVEQYLLELKLPRRVE